MSDNANSEAPVQETEFKNRKNGLVVFGILLLLIGALFAIILVFSIIGLVVIESKDTGTAPPLSSMIMGISIYAVLSAAMVWLGIGSLKAKRWARALILIGSWFTFIMGIFALFFMATIMRDFFNQMPQSGQFGSNEATILQTIFYTLIIIFNIILPGIFILFYKSKNVKATCDNLDPRERWTDKCPLPVLALSIILAFGLLSMVTMLVYGSVVALFGIYVSGIPGTIIILAVAVVLGFLARSTYNLDVKAWWGVLVLTIAGSLSYIITFSVQGVMAMYEKMNFPPEQLSLMKEIDFFEGSSFIIYMVVTYILYVGYLVYVKRFFPSPDDQM